MRKYFIYALMFLSAASAAAATPNIKLQLEKFRRQHHIPGMVVIYIQHGEQQQYLLGQANATKRTAVKENTLFELGSVTKLFPALLLAQQYDDGKVSLAAPLQKYLQHLPQQFAAINLEQLATHTSGLSFKTQKPLQHLNELRHLNLAGPKQTYQYSNLGIGLLGLALSAEAKQPLEKLYHHNIFQPLHMPHITLKINSHLAQGYDEKNHAVKPSSVNLISPAAYGLKASAADMTSFLKAAIGMAGVPDRILYPMKMTQAPFVQLPHKQQGLVWEIHPLKMTSAQSLIAEKHPTILQRLPITATFKMPRYTPNALIDKTGATDGFRAYIAVIPGQLSGIVILANKALPEQDGLAQLGRKILLQAK